MKNSIYDVIIVGAGAAGLMAAVICRRGKLNALLLDGQIKIGAKILMSGGTRCNVTNLDVTQKDYESETLKSVRNVLSAFPSARTLEFFKSLGVRLLMEEGGKFFPSTNSAKTVLDALMREIERQGVVLKISHKVKTIRFREGIFQVAGENFEYLSSAVILTTGGLSYPGTGSDGAGYRLAKEFGHRVVPTIPALTPLTTQEADWKSIRGVSLPARLTLVVDGKKGVSFEGSFLFTHFGFSGTPVLNISRHWLRLKDKRGVKLWVDFWNRKENFEEVLLNYTKKFPKRLLKSFLEEYFPARFIEVIFKKARIDERCILNQLKRQDRLSLGNALLLCELKVNGVFGYGKAEVTAGGVDLKEIDDTTMESRLQPGLFFAGEVLDVDGHIGGFNFQWAWSSGAVAGLGVAKRLSLKN